MSQRITSKNLQYNSVLPPFLARLRGQADAESDANAPDPILAARRRPVKPRSRSEEAEDAPLVVDEHGNAVDVAVNADGSVKARGSAAAKAGEEAQNGSLGKEGQADLDAAPSDKMASIGDGLNQRKKRKMGKVIGADADEEDGEPHDGNGRQRGSAGTDKTKGQDDSTSAAKAKAKKKAKKIKLSFGDDEG